MKNKRLFAALFAAIMVCAVVLAACPDIPNNPDEFEIAQAYTFAAASDDNYALELEGIAEGTISVTKGELKAFYNANQDKRVIAISTDRIYVSDKDDQDNPGKKESCTLKGVYLDDVLAFKGIELSSNDFLSMTFFATDGYVKLSSANFRTGEGETGSKIIIALEFQGEVLTPDSQSGALRAVLSVQPKNTWIKFLKKITFGDIVLSAPAINNVRLMETLPADYYDKFTEGSHIYEGISFAKLLHAETGIMTAAAADVAYIYATDGKIIANEYNVYKDAFLVYTDKEGSTTEAVPVENAPVFYKKGMLSGMKVKGVYAANIKGNALVSMDLFMGMHAQSGAVAMSKLVEVLKIPAVALYTIETDGGAIDILASEFSAATIKKEGGNYILTYGGTSAVVKSFGVKADFPVGLTVDIEVYKNAEALGKITNTSFKGLSSVLLDKTPSRKYVAFNLAGLLTNEGITAGEFTGVSVRSSDSAVTSYAISNVADAWITVSSPDLAGADVDGPRFVPSSGEGVGSNQVAKTVVRITFTAPQPMPEDFPAGLTVNIGIFSGDTQLGTITNDSFRGLSSTLLTSTPSRQYTAFSLAELLANEGLATGAFDGVTVEATDSFKTEYTGAEIKDAFIAVSSSTLTPVHFECPRFIPSSEAGLAGNRVAKLTAKITFNKQETAEMPSDFPAGLTVNIEIWQGGVLLGTITNDSFRGLTSTVLDNTQPNQGRSYVAFNLAALLANEGIVLSAFTGLTVDTSDNMPAIFSTNSIADAWITVSIVSASPNDGSGPRFVPSSTEEVTGQQVIKLVSKITFNA
ncbi:MAG: molybdopterin-dependent oxidoreductase [Firmicutes bacterium]|nr:molybdopterin-dependent oxidoreductase [Bacillota bacterium]